ncbi:MAG: hypothetical protein H0X13_00325 [Ramlibacter sp.]|nr:hypothetical protein [Ramlibacter sp.]
MLIAANRWNRVARPWFPWVPTLERIISREPLEALDGPEVQIFSDYGGEHKASDYLTTGALYVDLLASRHWLYQRADWRGRHLPDGRRLGFKGLNDRQKQAALVPFLEAAQHISGLLVVIAVHKSVVSPCFGAAFKEILETRIVPKLAWRPRKFERMLQVAHLVALMLGGLGVPGQNAYWFSDEDELFANEVCSQDLAAVLGLLSGNYVRHTLGNLGLGTTSVDEGDRYEEDSVAVVDLAVGAVAEHVTTLRRRLGHLPTNVAYECDAVFSTKTEVISGWFGDKSSRLRKVLVVFEPAPNNKTAVFKMDFSHREKSLSSA